METPYIVYYNTDDNRFRAWHSDGGRIETLSRIPYDVSSFYLTKGYEPTDDDLARYGRDVLLASNELKQSHVIQFDYIEPFTKSDGGKMYRTHTSNIETLFKRKTKTTYGAHDVISYIEDQWFDKCYNGGLMYCMAGEHDSYGYDFQMYYASILASKDFRIPTKQGEQIHLDELPEELEYGFYKVRITCDHPDIGKVFNFSKDHTYTDRDIIFIREIQERFNVKMELIQCEHNAYIYDSKCLKSSYSIFKYWYDDIIRLKQENPKNILIKMLSSSLWGHLSKRNTMYKTEAEIDNDNLVIGMTTKADYIILDELEKPNGEIVYKLFDHRNPYKYNIRLKPFITSYGRVKTARTALLQLDSVIRIHTDGIMFNKPFNHKVEKFVAEDKTTGHILIKNINNYKKV